MHGLINRAIQRFVQDTYGDAPWLSACQKADLEYPRFEAMLTYDDAITERVLAAIFEVLERPRAEVMEDFGTYLVSNPNIEALRRLLRFGGVDFVEFLHSLDDLPDRARMAVSDLALPRLELRDHSQDHFSLICHEAPEGFGHVMVGLLRAMADDYGALVYLVHRVETDAQEVIDVTLIESDFADGRSFELGARAG